MAPNSNTYILLINWTTSIKRNSPLIRASIINDYVIARGKNLGIFATISAIDIGGSWSWFATALDYPLYPASSFLFRNRVLQMWGIFINDYGFTIYTALFWKIDWICGDMEYFLQTYTLSNLNFRHNLIRITYRPRPLFSKT